MKENSKIRLFEDTSGNSGLLEIELTNSSISFKQAEDNTKTSIKESNIGTLKTGFMKKNLKILLLEDNPADVGLLKIALQKAGMSFSLAVVATKEDFIEGLLSFKPDIILSDHSLPAFNSIEALAIVKSNNLDTPFILVSGTVSEEFAIDCMKSGVDDYLIKDSLVRLPSSIEAIFSRKETKRGKESIELLHKELKNAYQDIAEKNKSITDSINYAKRIQDAILPDNNTLNNFFSEWFIYYKPKDIVSGDFYWFEELEDKIIIATADCTGHGVPGALMSVIGIELLNKVINEKKITSPSEILRHLNFGIAQFFKTKENIASATEGMDIVICTINRTNNTLEYAGANRPLWLIKNNVFEEIKPTKHPIGGMQQGENRVFESHTLSFNVNDIIYFFTDGFTDQFGGKNDKKLMKKKFRDFLLSIRENNMIEQKSMLTEFMEKWKENTEQVDDMLVMGIRF